MTELATMRQFAEFRHVQFDASDVVALRALEDASALFRSLAAQTISPVLDDEVELEGNDTGRLWLPERPVLGVAALSVRYAGVAEPTVVATGVYQWTRRGLVMYDGCGWGGTNATIHVKYSHGYAEIPEDISAVVMAMAARQMANPEGSTSDNIGLGSASRTYTPIGLSAAEERVIERYRPVVRY